MRPPGSGITAILRYSRFAGPRLLHLAISNQILAQPQCCCLMLTIRQHARLFPSNTAPRRNQSSEACHLPGYLNDRCFLGISDWEFGMLFVSTSLGAFCVGAFVTPVNQGLAVIGRLFSGAIPCRNVATPSTCICSCCKLACFAIWVSGL